MRILVITDDHVGPTMAGSALRAWELARALAGAGNTVRVVGAPPSRSPDADGPEVIDRPPWRWAEAVVVPPWCAPPRAFAGRHLLVADGATPLLAELRSMPRTPAVARRLRTAAARMPLVLARADVILAAGPVQVGWWQDALSDVRPGVPVLDVPFGISGTDPGTERAAVAGVPDGWTVVLWWGGVWPWLDLDTLLAARAGLGSAPLSVVVPTAPRPGSQRASFSEGDLQAAASAHGLEPPQVVPLTRWVDYGERHRILNRSAVVAVLHRAGREAELSFRTRALDGLWTRTPLLLSAGGEVATLTRDNGWGAVVPPGDVEAAAAALRLLVTDEGQRRCRLAMTAGRSAWTWPRVAAPLVEILPQLPHAKRRPLARPFAAAAAILGGARSTEAWR